MAAKRADVFLAVLTRLTVHATFFARRCAFVTGDGISITFHIQEFFVREFLFFTYSSLFCSSRTGELHIRPS